MIDGNDALVKVDVLPVKAEDLSVSQACVVHNGDDQRHSGAEGACRVNDLQDGAVVDGDMRRDMARRMPFRPDERGGIVGWEVTAGGTIGRYLLEAGKHMGNGRLACGLCALVEHVLQRLDPYGTAKHVLRRSGQYPFLYDALVLPNGIFGQSGLFLCGKPVIDGIMKKFLCRIFSIDIVLPSLDLLLLQLPCRFGG